MFNRWAEDEEVMREDWFTGDHDPTSSAKLSKCRKRQWSHLDFAYNATENQRIQLISGYLINYWSMNWRTQERELPWRWNPEQTSPERSFLPPMSCWHSGRIFVSYTRGRLKSLFITNIFLKSFRENSTIINRSNNKNLTKVTYPGI